MANHFRRIAFRRIAAAALAVSAASVSGQNSNLPIIPIQPGPHPITLVVWGFADLHTHPASFLGFGAKNETNGPMWGKPAHDNAMDVATSSETQNLNSDLPPCPIGNVGGFSVGITHNSASDPITQVTDAMILNTLDQTSPGFTHQTSGSPGFQSWPAALTVDHQVMHINNIQRAWQGGLRLMFAAATDDQLISQVWDQGFNVAGNKMPAPVPMFDYNSAVQQLTYITNLVNANSTWMQIVSNPTDAAKAINSGKLAVVLSLEMDSLTLQEIQLLVNNFHVAHVIPIHLADNSFGGTAAYSDVFNGLSNFLNGSPESTTADPNVNFMFGIPAATIAPVSGSTVLNLSSGQYQAIDVLKGAFSAFGGPIESAVAAALSGGEALPAGAFGYLPVMPTSPGLDKGEGPGQINTRDLDQSQFFELMKMGLLLDVAHMGQKTASTALNMALQYHYPLMDSHTGVRCDYPSPTTGFKAVQCGAPLEMVSIAAGQVDERALPASQIAILQQLRGVIGLGLVPSSSDPVTTWINNYSAVLNLMGGKGVALGTDADGLSPMIGNDSIATTYPITVAANFGCPQGCPASLPQYHFGGGPSGPRTYNFENDGIANYGLLPDFIQAASEPRPLPVVVDQQCVAQCYKSFPCIPAGTKGPPNCSQYGNCTAKCPKSGGGQGPAPTAQITALFHSAQDVIEMWQKVQAAVLITSPDSSTGQAGQPYSQTLSATGGTPPYQWSLQSGTSLPPGLTLDQNGAIAGTPTTGGSFNVTVVVQDSATPVAGTSSQQLMITLTGLPCLQNPSHKIIACGSFSPQTCVIPPAGCPTCPPGQVLTGGICIVRPLPGK
jgi:microsomal dipeptidase-like Zn-dependent dipeptidase